MGSIGWIVVIFGVLIDSFVLIAAPPPQGYPPQGYPQGGYPPQGYPQQGGYPPQQQYPQQYGNNNQNKSPSFCEAL